MYTVTEELLNFIEKSPSCYHAVDSLAQMLEGYQPLEEKAAWKLKRGGKYFVVRKDSSIIAFRIPKRGKGKIAYESVYMTAAHSDSPSFKVKTNPEMVVEGHYTKLNTEKYGGMLMATWFDRPLSVAGRVIVKEKGVLTTKLVNIDRDLLMIPSVAIHMNRNANDGYKYDAQVDTLPLFGDEVAKTSFMNLVAESAGVEPEAILGTDLFLYVRQPGTIWGANREFVSARALDDLQCAFATMKGFVEAKDSKDKLCLCCVFDNEEVGSLTGQGADSTFLSEVLLRINEALEENQTTLSRGLANGYMISADNAHAVHPNHPEYADPTNRPYLNQGIVMKFNAAQKYTTDGISEAMFRSVCQEAKAPVQTFTNKSNMAGGSTLGNIANRHVSIPTVDIGLPQLAMHSAYETAGALDTAYLVEATKVFFS